MFAIQLIQLIFIILLNKLFAEPIDPELQLCLDLTIDAAVSADDGIDYIFKGDYYWQFSTATGISPEFIARPINDRWPGLTGPIDAAFVIDEATFRLSTVFIKDNQWFLYKQGLLEKNGTTDGWPSFTKDRIQGAFDYRFNKTMERKECPIIFIYNKDKYLRYVIENIEKPMFVSGGSAHRIGKYFYFLQIDGNENSQTIADYIDVKAIISNRNDLIFFGDKQFCWANVSVPSPPCFKTEGINLTHYFGCPRNPYPIETTEDDYPTTGPTATTSTNTFTAPLNFSSIITSMAAPETPSLEDDSLTTNIITDSEEETMNSTHELTEMTTLSVFTSTIAEGGQQNVANNNKKTDWTSTIILMIIICIICLVSLLVIVVAVRNHKKNKLNSGKEQKKPQIRSQSTESLSTGLKLSESTLIDSQNSDSMDDSQRLQLSSDESLDKAIEEAGISTNNPDIKIDDKPAKNGQIDDIIEADQVIEHIKSKDNFDD